MNPPKADGAAPADVLFALTPGFTMIAFASAVETMRLANYCAGRALYSWRLASPDGAAVAASNGIAVPVDDSFATMAPAPLVFVCGGVGVESLDHAALIARLRKFAKTPGVALGSLCLGAHVLAKAGVLDGHRCAAHWENLEGFREAFPRVDFTGELFERDRGRVTCAGGTAAIDLMLTYVAEAHGADLARAVTDELIHHRLRDSSERQRMDLRARIGVAHPKLLAAIAGMEAHLEEPLDCAALARAAKLSTRQLERLFGKYIGESPTRYYLRLRLDRARALLRQTSLPVLSVGLACGFVSASHFTKCYSERFGRTPSRERGRDGTRAKGGEAAG